MRQENGISDCSLHAQQPPTASRDNITPQACHPVCVLLIFVMIDNDKKGDGTTDQKHRIDSDLQQQRTWLSAPYLGRCQEIPASLLKTKQFNSLNILPIQDDIAG